MLFLLTPVALICPVLNVGFAEPVTEQESKQQIQCEQAICRIHKLQAGETSVSVGMHSIAIYPIHYVDGDEPYLVFSVRMLSQHNPVRVQLWTGDLYEQRQSSEPVNLNLTDGDFQMPVLHLQDKFDKQRDQLCLTFLDEHGMQTAAQIKLEITGEAPGV